jgi:uncharacterized protein
MPMLIDFHTHTFPDELAPRAIAQLAAEGPFPYYSDGTCDGLLASMRLAGITHSVMAPIATKPSQVRRINAWTAEMNARHPGLIGFGTLHPRQDDWDDEVAFLVEHGIKGIKLHADYQRFFVDEDEVIPMYRTVARAGLIVLFHAGVDIGLPPPVHCPPERLARVLDAVPELQVVAAHMGGFRQWELVEQHLLGRRLYLDTSFALPWMGPERLMSLMRGHSVRRILFATDSPWADQAGDLAAFRALPLTDEEREAITWKNAAQLLKLEGA